VHTQIRLAKAQGLLQGRGLSLVQAHAIYLLDSVEVIRENKQEDRELNLALLAAGTVSFGKLFPEYLGQTQPQEVGPDDLDSALNNEGDEAGLVRYASPPEEMTEERMNELLGQLMAENSNGSLNGNDTRNDGWM